MKVLITGCQGQVVRSLLERGASRTGLDLLAAGRPQADFEQPGAIADVIGKVRLNGQDGIPRVPPLEVPFVNGPLSIEGVFVLSGVLLILAYVGLRIVLTTRFGRILVGIRENERRAISLGYRVDRYKLGAFVMSAALAGLAGGTKAIVFQFASTSMVMVA